MKTFNIRKVYNNYWFFSNNQIINFEIIIGFFQYINYWVVRKVYTQLAMK